MIIIKVMGGLGNQMQQYALYEKFKSMGRDARLDISWFEDAAQQENVLARRKLELRMFENLEFEACTAEERRALLGKGGLAGKVLRKLSKGKEKLLPGKGRPENGGHFYESGMYHPEILGFTDCYLEGHWACEKYYQNILPLLREKIKFPKSKNILNQKIKEEMITENSVSIHIRRGDYLDPENAGMFGGICTEEYYRAAEEYIRKRVPDAHFYLFSDDSDYLREHYQGEEYTIVDWNKGEDSFYDMELMSHCRHNICANSTFSFWGARLNPAEVRKETTESGSRNRPECEKCDPAAASAGEKGMTNTPLQGKIMIRPAKHKNSQVIDPKVMHELWEDWVLIDEKGNVI